MPVSDEYIANENKYKAMTEVWIPCVPIEGGPANFILYSRKTPKAEDVDRLMGTTTHTGMVVNDIRSLASDTEQLLRQGMPQVNIDTAYIFEVGRKPAGIAMYGSIILGGLLLMLAGLFWMFFLHFD